MFMNVINVRNLCERSFIIEGLAIMILNHLHTTWCVVWKWYSVLFFMLDRFFNVIYRELNGKYWCQWWNVFESNIHFG